MKFVLIAVLLFLAGCGNEPPEKVWVKVVEQHRLTDTPVFVRVQHGAEIYNWAVLERCDTKERKNFRGIFGVKDDKLVVEWNKLSEINH